MPALGAALWLAGLIAIPGWAARIGEVQILGLPAEQQDNVQRLLSLYAARERGELPPSRLRFLFAQAEDEIRRALEPFGYYHPVIRAELDSSGSTWSARFEIDPGAPSTVVAQRIVVEGEGADEPLVRERIAGFEPGIGQVLDHRRYEASRQALLAALAELGYFDARLRRARVELDLREPPGQAEIQITVDSGVRYRFGEVEFEGSQFDDAFMQRFVDFELGQPYTQAALLRMQRRLVDSDYFAFANVTPVPEEGEDGVVPIRVSVAPRPRHLYTAGIVLGTDSGLGLRGGVERRWVNMLGHRAKIDASLAQRRNLLALGYTIPRFERGAYTIGLNLRDEETDSAELRAAEVVVSRLFQRWGWSQIVAIRALREDYQIAGLDEVATLVYPSWRLSRSVSDDLLVPTRGHALVAELRAGSEVLLSDVDFAQARGEARWIRGIGEDWRVLARAELGATWTDRFDRLPVSLRYFAGGDRSVRGYAFQELGPLNADGEVIGGRYLAAGSLEVERMIRGPWGLAAFVDAGNAFNERADFELARGVGLGLRWRSPIGTVRVDLASALDKSGRPLRLHLMIGPEL